MFAGTGKLCKDEGLYTSRENYSAGYALYAFDLTEDLGEEDHFSLMRQGSVRLSLKFSAALANTYTAVAYAEFDNVIEVTGTSSSTLEYEHGKDRSHPSTKMRERC